MKTLNYPSFPKKESILSTSIKTSALALLTLIFALNISYSQEEPTMFAVHTDNVKFEKMQAYEKLSKQLKDNFVKYNLDDTNWTAISTQGGSYVYVTPIKSMADLDKNIMKGLADKIGKEAVNTMLDSMDECYDSHSDHIIHYIKDLSYEPEGYSTAGKNYREYHYIYYAPKNAKKVKEAIANVKALYTKKGLGTGYSIYHSGFGSEESYYLVSIAGKDNLDVAKMGKNEDEQLGEERKPTMLNLITLSTKYEKIEARIRPDLSYTATKD